MSEEQSGYISYLLRMWKTRSAGRLVWRASLESPHSGERVSFTSLADLFSFLKRETSLGAPQRPAPAWKTKGGDRSR